MDKLKDINFEFVINYKNPFSLWFVGIDKCYR